MGQAKQRQRNKQKDFLEYLNTNYQEGCVFRYPCGEHEGIFANEIPFLMKTYKQWKQDRICTLKLKLIDYWLADYNREMKSGDIWTIKSRLLMFNPERNFLENMKVALYYDDLWTATRYYLLALLAQSKTFLILYSLLLQMRGFWDIKSSSELVRGTTIFMVFQQYFAAQLYQDKRLTEIVVSQAYFVVESATYEPADVLIDNGEIYFNRSIVSNGYHLPDDYTMQKLNEFVSEVNFDWETMKCG